MLRSSFAIQALAVAALACSASTSAFEPTTQESSPRPQATAPDATMLRFPDIGRERIVFVYANDLWTVDRAGGEASPLASPPGAEQFPKFSRDDTTIAFMGNYDGNRDLYTVPTVGGVPVRVTHHPAGEILCDWTPGGELLFYAGGMSGLGRQQKLFTVGSGGGLPQALPLPYGTAGAIGPDGNWLAYTPHTRDARTWKRYRGGMATDIWLFHLETHESKKITDWEGTDTLPMWHGDRVFYLSDRGDAHKLNIWVYNPTTDLHEQVTKFTEFDVKWPSIGPGDRGQGEIVLQNGPQLHLVDLGTYQTRAVRVTIPGATPTVRTKTVDVSEFIQSWDISPSGKRAVVQARGDVWTLPAEKGSPRNLTRTSGAAEREPVWSPDGRWIAYFSDATGEYELYVTQSDGKGETKQLTSGSETYYYYASWSPDSKHILFADKAWQIYLHTIETGETKIIERDVWGMGLGMSWSHDSRWLAYSMGTEDQPVPRIWLYEVATGERHAVTSGMFPDSSPVFDRKGDYLFFVSGRSFTPTGSDLFFDDNFIYEDTQRILAVPLLAETKSPWLAESDEETWDDEEEGEEEEAEEKPEEEDSAEAESADEEAAVSDDDVSGTWEGIAGTPDGELPFTLQLRLHADNSVTGTLQSVAYGGEFTGNWFPDSHSLSGTLSIPGQWPL